MITGLLLYSNCILVKGAARSAICDLQRKYIYPIPNVMAALFTGDRYFNYPHLLQCYPPALAPVLKEYQEFLTTRELAFPCLEADMPLFPEISREWIFPGQITHCILDTDSGTYPFFNTAFTEQLDALGCRFLQFRFFSGTCLDYLEQLMALTKKSSIDSIELLLPASPGLVQESALWVRRHRKISALILHSAQESGLIQEGREGAGYVIATKEIIRSHRHCGQVDTGLFALGITAFTEALHHNTCLNRKISIDVEGYIRNCPSMPEHFGHIKDTTLAQAVAEGDFKKYWNITKDEITKCKDCEFRYVCTDCRAYLDQPDDRYSAPLKCGYDPYTCRWEDWSTHPMKQQAIDFYDMRARAGQ